MEEEGPARPPPQVPRREPASGTTQPRLSLEAQVDADLKDAITKAEDAAPPALETMFDDVFAKLPWHLEEQKAQLLAGPRAKGHGQH